MTPTIIILVLISTFLHAGWNLLTRRQRSEVVFLRRALIVIAVVGFLPAVISEAASRSLPPKAWACALGSGLSMGVYFLALAHAYAASDFTIVYPLSRAMPILFIGLGDVLRGHPLSAIGWTGMMFVVAGCFLTPLRSFREFEPKRYFQKSIIWVALTGLGVIGFSMFDKIGSETVKQGFFTAGRYGYVEYALACLIYWSFYHGRHGWPEGRKTVGWFYPLLGGAGTFIGYWLILYTFQLSDKASYIFTFRQFSIIIGVVLAFALYHEKGKAVRLTGTALITLGLILVGVWGK